MKKNLKLLISCAAVFCGLLINEKSHAADFCDRAQLEKFANSILRAERDYTRAHHARGKLNSTERNAIAGSAETVLQDIKKAARDRAKFCPKEITRLPSQLREVIERYAK